MARQPTRHPRHPPRAPTGSPPIAHPPGTSKRPSRANSKLAVQRAVGNVRNALMEAGTSPAQALHLARILLSHPGVTIGAGKAGNIFFKGERFSPAQFAASPLANLATGKTAQARNEKVIEGDPSYLQAIANLQLQRNQSTAGLDDQRRQALIQFGDPTFAGSDAQTAAAASMNPFGTSQLLARQFSQANLATQNAANRAGVFNGGGLQSGLGQNQQDYAGQNQSATLALQNLLASIGQQQSLAGQAYQAGQNQAHLDAYNALLQSGWTAAQAPNWSIGQFHVRHPNAPRPGGGGGGRAPSFPTPPARGTLPTQTTFPGGGPVIFNPGTGQPIPTPQPPRQPQVPPTAQPLTADLMRRYGL